MRTFVMDRQRDRRTDRQTDGAGYRGPTDQLGGSNKCKSHISIKQFGIQTETLLDFRTDHSSANFSISI